MVNSEGVLEITHAFPVPDMRLHSSNANDNDDENTMDAGSSDYQIEMMRMLKEVNVDYNCVGWYQSMYLGIHSTTSTLENQLSYQNDLSPNAVVLLFDPLQSIHGKLVLKCYRLSEECAKLRNEGSNEYLDPHTIFEEVPIKFTNAGLVRAFLRDVHDNVHTLDTTSIDPALTNTTAVPTTTNNPRDVVLDRLDLSTHAYLEKHMEYMSTWTDELVSEQQKLQYYSRQLARGDKYNNNNPRTSRSSEGGWASVDAPRRLESLLLVNQLGTYCDQVDEFTQESLTKLYAVKSLLDTKQTTLAHKG